ncbi:glycosyl transferase [Paenibacillus baekrokdamisoli]|uniref:Glycosyl transferase n=1 Tax=Paenibacillus baekrokdamisoli TaxID=1712516 RepID=A0A3G9J0W9_9BACL|nr:glycosyltransferase family 1 protein [Paenibacillus baekrokdamisoli]MBB3072237.1 glycosyltransferase involved in cell wall biosynthesis [Paenibacillus baekrokdamisoli]BBH24820.1 glycosyl transferase [Paenibacillus baekrokdamisoli]
MRLALFTDTYEPDVNGVARTLARWVEYLRRKGIPVLVFAPDPADDRERAAMASVERFASFPFFLYPECRLALPRPIYIRRALHAFGPTLIHVATPFNMGLCGVHYARKYQVPLVASYHTHFDRYLPFYNLHWMVKMLWRYMNWFHHDSRSIFVPSRSTLLDLKQRGWDEARLEVWTRGIDTKQYHPGVDRNTFLTQHDISPDKFIVLYTGRLSPEKNVDVALAAFAKFQRDICPDALFVLAGDGPSADLLKQQAERERIPTRFLGFTGMPNLQQWYAAADTFLFPSSTETFGNVVLEAMACGTPIVCADAGGVVDTVEHGWNGLICEAGNINAFSDALKQIHGNADLRGRLAARGIAYSLRQSWDTIFEELLIRFEKASDLDNCSWIRHISE